MAIFSHLKKKKDETEELVRLGPLARLYWTLDTELGLDPEFPDKDRYDRLMRMHQVAEQRRDSLFRNLVILDAIALLLYFGRDLTIPGLNLNISTLPAAREVVILFASVTFQYTAWAFVNWNGYTAMIDMINVRRAAKSRMDADFWAASDKYLDFALKMFRPKMDLRGPDILSSQWGYNLISRIIVRLLLISVMAFIFLHLVVVFISARASILSYGTGVLLYAYLVFIFAANFAGLLVVVAMSLKFNFAVIKPQQ